MARKASLDNSGNSSMGEENAVPTMEHSHQHRMIFLYTCVGQQGCHIQHTSFCPSTSLSVLVRTLLAQHIQEEAFRGDSHQEALTQCPSSSPESKKKKKKTILVQGVGRTHGSEPCDIHPPQGSSRQICEENRVPAAASSSLQWNLGRLGGQRAVCWGT